LLLVAVSVGLDNLGAATTLGVSGVDRKLRVRVALIFGAFEGAMPVIGLLLGHSLAGVLGADAEPIAGVLLSAAGAYTVTRELVGKQRQTRDPEPSTKYLVLLAGALSIDNLVIGFALGAYRVNIAVSLVTIATVSVGLSLLGLEIGGRLGGRLGQRSELVGGVLLMVVGVLVGTGVL
ncbi:MAG TPA: manganese efflux pump, partial [Acidimicrobiales bacterium]|nr:manganese efflux pump [Acidimicrobiales bacterium]